MTRRAYPSDLTDAQWAVLAPFLAAWKAKHPSATGHQGRYELREIVNAIFYQNRTGCQWAYLPHDLPPKSATYYYFALWRDDGTDQAIHDLLRCDARERAGRKEDPTAIVLDTQSCARPTMSRRPRPAGMPPRRCRVARGAWRWTSSA